MSVDTPPTDDELQTVLDDLGAGVNLEQEGVDVGFDLETQDGMEFTNATIVKPVIARRNEPLGEIQKEVMIDGNHAMITVQKRAECPACGYIPTQDGEPITLTGRCVECEQWTCTSCGADCFSCDQRLCRDHKDGYGMMGEVLCGKHRRDVEQEREAEWKSEFWNRHIEEESVLLEHETHREIAFKELELDAELQREQMKLEAEIQRRQQKLAEFEAKSEHLDKVERRKLEEKKFKLDRDQTKMEEHRKATRLALDEEIERREQSLKEWQAMADQRIEGLAQALEERKQRANEEQWRSEHEFEKEQFRREQSQEEYEFDKEHELDRYDHETEREDKRAQSDLDQQKVEIQKKEQEVDEWVKKRRQKLEEFKAVVAAEEGKDISNQGSGGDQPSWQDLLKVTEQLEGMKEPVEIEVD